MTESLPAESTPAPHPTPPRRVLRWMTRNGDLAPLAAAGLLIFGVVPPVPGIGRSLGHHQADFQAWLLVVATMLMQRGIRITRWVRGRRRTSPAGGE